MSMAALMDAGFGDIGMDGYCKAGAATARQWENGRRKKEGSMTRTSTTRARESLKTASVNFLSPLHRVVVQGRFAKDNVSHFGKPLGSDIHI